MDKDEKKKKVRAKKYEEKLVVKGSFMDVIKASAKDAEKRRGSKEKP